MDKDTVIFWFLIANCLGTFFVVLPRLRTIGWGNLAPFGILLLLTVIGRWLNQPGYYYAALIFWAIFILCPGLLARFYFRCSLQQDYKMARRWARLISWLNPLSGWRDQLEIIHAWELAQQGDMDGAKAIFTRYMEANGSVALVAKTQYYRLTGNWQEMLQWQQESPGQFPISPQTIGLLLRAKGEIGDITGMVTLYKQHQSMIQKMIPVMAKDLVRLQLFAFSGRTNEVTHLLEGTLAILSPAVKDFWRATATQTAGQTETARRQFELLLSSPDATLQLAAQRRLEAPPALPLLPDSAETAVLIAAAKEQMDEIQLEVRQPLFRQARATQILIGLNLLMFVFEIFGGGSEDGETLFQLGALYGPAVWHGQWWRLFTAIFLHLGWLHLTMNMLGLVILGPFMESALGFTRYLYLYLCAGIGSMAAVIAWGSGPAAETITVGASGSIMGLVGGTGAMLLRVWQRNHTGIAKRKLANVILIVVLQFGFDLMNPQSSMIGHLSGAWIGFLVALSLKERLINRNQA